MKENTNLLLQYRGLVRNGLAIIFVLSLLTVASCEPQQRDPKAEFETLRETVFPSPKQGEEAALKYIDEFRDTKGAPINEAYDIRNMYRLMDSFFSNVFSSYCDFLNTSKSIGSELSQTVYEGVRKTWQALYEKERNRLLASQIETITESDFQTFFESEVRKLCGNEFSLYSVEAIDQVSLSAPTVVNDGTAKEAHGEYFIHLRGKTILHSSGEARISIEGVIGFDETCNISAYRKGYQFTKRPAFDL